MNPPDQPARDAILGDLDTTFLVEAAAGTGKTTCMVGRMIALVREGRCPVENLAAVTFTRKAGAELRTRFQAALEQAVKDTSGKARENLDKALARVEQRDGVGDLEADPLELADELAERLAAVGVAGRSGSTPSRVPLVEIRRTLAANGAIVQSF